MPQINVPMSMLAWCWRKMAKALRATWKAAVFFLVCVVIAILVNMPVKTLLAQVNLPENIKVTGVRGTLLRGHVHELLVNRFPVQQLNYQADLSCLLKASWCYQLDYSDGSALLSLNAITQKIDLNAVNVEFPASLISTMTPQLLVSPSGSIMLQADSLSIKRGKLVDLGAILVWKNAGIVGEDLNLGDYQLDVAKESNQYHLSLQDNDSVLDIAGEGKLGPDGSYSLDIRIQSRSGLDSRIKNLLELVAKKNGLNNYNIRRSGRIDTRMLGFLFAVEE